MAYDLECLVRILEQFLDPHQQRWNIAHDKRPQLESLLEKASSLKQKLETCSPASTQNMESEIRDATRKAEDIIESHMVDQMLSEPEAKSFTISPPDLQQVIQELDAAMDNLMTLMAHGSHCQMPSYTSLPSPDSTSLITLEPDHPISSKDVVVGLDEDMLHLADLLTGDQKKLRVIPIIGMGGIGKTTLARKLYNDHLIVSRFDIRAWTTISQAYNVKAILLGLLNCIIGNLPAEMLKEENRELGVRLHKSLFGNRYLIVLDDMWSINAWDEIKMFFPNENNGSRIMVTTRGLNVAKYVDPSEYPWHHTMHLLNEFQSWNLLQQKVFGKDECPTKFEGIGKSIAANCRGLPLAIHVIGGLLLKAKRAIDLWEHIAANIRATLSGKDDQVFNVLSLSYNYLPYHLKPCYLYMAAFPEDYKIRASKLMRLWVAEGFLKSNGCKNLEEEAKDCLKALVDRNLVEVTKHKSNGKAKSYRIHDLLRDLCIRKADQEKFLFVPNSRGHCTVPEDPSYSLRRVGVSTLPLINGLRKCMSLARSFLYIGRTFISYGYRPLIGRSLFPELRLLRVLDVIDILFGEFPTQVLQLFNLRYLAVTCYSDVPATVSRLQNLQTFILGSRRGRSLLLHRCIFPIEIFLLPELRHLKFESRQGIYIQYNSGKKNFVHEKLQTLATISIYPDLLESIPNIKNLSIDLHDWTLEIDLHHLNKLETLRLSRWRYCGNLRIPLSLRKLSLDDCLIPWGFMTIVASSLPNLEVLKICYSNFETQKIHEQEEWELTGEQFFSLRFLLLENLALVHWRAAETNFPRLRHLLIRGCYALKEIPDDIGDTLELIEVVESDPGVVYSARQIKEKQHELGNDDIEVRIC